MSRNYTIIFVVASVVLALAIFGGLTWANTLYVRTHPGEKDFFVPWLAARTFIQYGDSPYSEPSAQRAQIVYYGHLATDNESPLYLWLPLPVELVYFPFALVQDYAVARGLWMTFLEIALVALAIFSVQVTGWKAGRILLPFILVLSVLWVYGFFSLIDGSAVIFVVLALVGFLLALRTEHDELAGALLCILLSAPRLTGGLLLFLAWWIIYHRRWRVVGGFFMLLAFLLVLSFFLLPDWFIPFLHGAALQNISYPGVSTISIFASWSPVLGLRLGWVLSLGLLFILFLEWGFAIQRDFRRFLWIVSLTLASTVLLGIPVIPRDLVLLFFPLISLASILAQRWPRFLWIGAAAFTLMLVFGGLWLLVSRLSPSSVAGTETLMLVLPVLLVVGLYWVRWWVVRSEPETLE